MQKGGDDSTIDEPFLLGSLVSVKRTVGPRDPRDFYRAVLRNSRQKVTQKAYER